ncbi:MAG: hypothetical protein ACXWUG_05265 [Polyangiales bacterium]
MFIVAKHTINDPAKFWGDPDVYKKVPKQFTLHSTFGNAEGTQAVCIWEAASAEELQKFLDGLTGPSAKNELMLVDPKHSYQLPTIRRAA